MDRDALATSIFQASHLTGTFALRSGQTATEYFDKFQFTSRPGLLDDVSNAMAKIVPPDVEVLAGLQLGGVPLAAALALKTGLPAVYVRPQRKAYGTCKLIEGIDVAGGKVVAIVEDVVTTGGQIILSTDDRRPTTDDLRAEGADVRYALAVVDRESGGPENLASAGLTFRAVFTASELEGATWRSIETGPARTADATSRLQGPVE